MNFGSPRAERFPYANLKAKDRKIDFLLINLNFFKGFNSELFIKYQTWLLKAAYLQ